VQQLKNKRYFIIIDKDEEHPKKPYFDLVMFELIRDDPYYHELTYLDVPFFSGTIRFDKEPDKINLSPFQLWKRQLDPQKKETVLKQIDPDLFRNFVLNAEFVVIGNHLNKPQGHGLENFQVVERDSTDLQNEQMSEYITDLMPIYTYLQGILYDKIRNYIFCHSCKMNKKFTLIDEETRFKSQAFFVCRDCAGKEVLAALKKTTEVTAQLKIYLRDLLKKYKDINKVLNVFSPNFNILEHPEATLVGVRKTSITHKVKPLTITDLDLPAPLYYYYQEQNRTELLPAQIMAIEAGLLENQSELIVSATSSGKTMIGELAGIPKIYRDKFQTLTQKKIPNPFENILFFNEAEKTGRLEIQDEDVNVDDNGIDGDENQRIDDIKDGPKNSDSSISHKSRKFQPTPDQKVYLNQLAQTSSHQKMLYVVPIVALANMRYREYAELKRWGITAALRVGISHMNKKKRNADEFGNFGKADIIVATYEAVDILLRSGHPHLLRDIRTVIIDEIQMLADPERGFILDGMIARLHAYLTKTQFVYLSATISDPQGLAQSLRSALVHYSDRPVPIERHLVMCMDENTKYKNMLSLVRNEFRNKSSFGYRGQSIIFTNSRKNTEKIAEYLTQNNVRSYAYHAGLTYDMRKFVEKSFEMQKVACVVTTAALAAGVDFPASQVLFANLTMGIKWLTVADFEQMSGRAGRLKKHDMGRVYVLVTPGKNYVGTTADTEERVAVQLLNGKIEPLQLEPDEDANYTELLATIAMFTPVGAEDRGMRLDTLTYYQSLLYNGDFSLKQALASLTNQLLIKRVANNQEVRPTTFGKAVAESFLRIAKALEIRNALMQPVTEENPAPDMLDLARSLYPFKNVYVTNRLLSEISTKNQGRPTSNNLFSNAILGVIDAQHLGKKSHVSRRLFNVLRAWSEDIFNCKCKDAPYCDCGRSNVERIIIENRLAGMGINELIAGLAEEYEIQTFRGDLTDFFEGIIYALLSIQKMGRALALAPQTMLKIRNIPRLVAQIIQPVVTVQDDEEFDESEETGPDDSEIDASEDDDNPDEEP
jgi:superfamily II helicase